MKSVRSRSWSAALLSATLTVGVLGVGNGTSLAATGTYDPNNPPYPADANAVTTVRIYDATTGAEVKSGNTDTPLSNYYFSAATDFGQPDAGGGRKAQLSGFLAESGKVPTAFSGQLLGPATTFPVTVGSSTFSNPTARGDSAKSFGALAVAFPNTAPSTDNFYQLYQLRVRTTFPTPTSTTYAIVDVQIDPATGIWHEVKPATAPYSDPPSRPAAPTATAGDSSASVTFAPPATPAGAPILDYSVVATPTNPAGPALAPVVVSGSPATVTGLTNGTTYTFTITARNANGSSARSLASNAVIPAPAPGAPTAVTATGGDASASVAFTPPAANGGPAITSYTVTSAPGGLTATGTTSPISVTGLTNGTSYTFTVHATNSIGDGPESAASNAVTPVAVPAAPSGVTATPGDTTADVSWTAPAANGSAITSYDVTAVPSSGTTVNKNVPGTSTTLTGLTNGTTYSVTVTATNGVGTSPSSAAVPVTPRTVPGAPTAVTATAGNGSASVAFTAPADNGGAPVSSYTVTSSPGNVTGTGSASPVTVSGLTNGTSYTFTVTATNAAGTGGASPTSNAVTPASAPGAPTGVTATNGDTTSDVAWTAPASDGGSAVTGYIVTATPTSGVTVTKSVTGTSTTLTGLTNGSTYSVTVVATNAVGSSPSSSAANASPYGVPNAPAKPTGTAGNGQVSVAFVTPANNGSPITSYTVTASPGGATATGSSSPLIVTGLTNGTPYTFTVTATNARGTSAASPASDAVTPGVKTATTTTLAATPHDVYYGATIPLRGTVTGVTGAQSVVVRAYYRSGAVDTTYSAPDGHLSVNVTARQNVTYRLLYLGDSAHSSSVSAALRTTVHGRLAIGTLTRGIHKVTITGLIRPGVNGQSVTLYELRGGRLYGLKRVLTASNGRFTVGQAATSGRHVYRLIGAASPITGITNTVQVIVTIA